MEAKIAPGRPQDDEKWSKNFSGPPPARTSDFFFAPGGLQEHSGVDFYSALAAPWGPLGPQVVPGGLPEASRRPPGGHLSHFRNNFGFIFESFLVTFAAVLAPVLGPPRLSFSFAPCHVLIPFRWRARVRSLFLEGFEALSWKIGRPRFLKPWVAAGGREAIRIHLNTFSGNCLLF